MMDPEHTCTLEQPEHECPTEDSPDPENCEGIHGTEPGQECRTTTAPGHPSRWCWPTRDRRRNPRMGNRGQSRIGYDCSGGRLDRDGRKSSGRSPEMGMLLGGGRLVVSSFSSTVRLSSGISFFLFFSILLKIPQRTDSLVDINHPSLGKKKKEVGSFLHLGLIDLLFPRAQSHLLLRPLEISERRATMEMTQEM